MGLAHITLATRDVRRSADFFRDALGWSLSTRPGNIGMNAAWLDIAPGMELHLIEDPEFEPSRFEKEFGRHIAVTFDLAEFPRLKERLQARAQPSSSHCARHRFSASFFATPTDTSSRSSRKTTTSRDRSRDRSGFFREGVPSRPTRLVQRPESR